MRILATCLILAALSVPAALAQTAASTSPVMPPCQGVMAIIRLSDITPDGSMDKFMAAVAAQREWYKSHGLHDRIFASKVLVTDPATKDFVDSDKQALTYHLFPVRKQPSPAHDSGWNDFVKLFSETSTIQKSVLTCLPKDMVRGK